MKVERLNMLLGGAEEERLQQFKIRDTIQVAEKHEGVVVLCVAKPNLCVYVNIKEISIFSQKHLSIYLNEPV